MATAVATMAASIFPGRPTICSSRRGIPLVTLPITQFLNGQLSSLRLSSSHCITGLRPIVLSEISRRSPQTPAIFCAKGYKMKTHKASAKRFRVSGSGKIMRRRAGKQHLNRKKNTKRKLRLSKMVQVDRSDYDNVIGALPYLKVNRSN